MSCSADYYLELNSRLNGRFFATKNHKKMRQNILLLTLEALTSRRYQFAAPTIINCEGAVHFLFW
jgi:hypothetical protein